MRVFARLFRLVWGGEIDRAAAALGALACRGVATRPKSEGVDVVPARAA